MKRNPADPVRRQACLALHAVFNEGRSLSALLEQPTLEERGRARCRALCYAACRWRFRLEAVVDRLVQKPFRRRDARARTVILLALTELEYLDGAPHAVVDSAVTLVQDFGHGALRGVVNAVLRRFLREREAMLASVDRDAALAAAFPPWIAQRLGVDWPEDAPALLDASNARAPMTLRVAARLGRDEYHGRLAAAGIDAQPGPGRADLQLAAPCDVSDLPGFAQGDCSVQDSAAQFAAALLAPQPPERVLDACAAPGGKTGHLLEQGAAPERLTVIDADAQRLERVHSNLARLQYDGVRGVVADAASVSDWWDGELFDAILLDAPCSALGVIRRHPDIKSLRRADDLEPLAALQSSLLDALWSVLKPGGRLLYATCSITRLENEEQVAAFLERTADATAETVSLPVGRPVSVGWQILPGEMGCDGFYYALLQRQSGPASA